jgi:hypothetical protein
VIKTRHLPANRATSPERREMRGMTAATATDGEFCLDLDSPRSSLFLSLVAGLTEAGASPDPLTVTQAWSTRVRQFDYSVDDATLIQIDEDEVRSCQ